MVNRYFPRSFSCLLYFAAFFASAAFGADDFRFGPLWDHFQLTLQEGHRTEAGPFFYDEHQDTRRTWAVTPLLSYTRDPALDMEEFDLGYPVLTYDRYGSQYRWQLFQLLSFAGGQTQTETKRKRFTIFPIYFQQRSSDPDENYTAYGPFYGNLKHRLMRDEIHYVMFPIYSRTRKGDVVTKNYVYPFFHLRQGAGLEGWQFWPVTGHEHKEITTRTNGFGDIEQVPGHDTRFVLWPFYFNKVSEIGTTNETRQTGVIPAYSLTRSPARDSTTVLWPFFSRIDDREKGYREWDAPWPLIVRARGPGKYTTRFWPIYSHAYNSNIVSDFYLWPVYKYNAIHTETVDRRRTRIAFFLYSNIREKNLETGASRRRVDLWPLFTSSRDLNGNKRLQVLSILEPILPGSHKIPRDYSHVWALWRNEYNAASGARSQSLLWNLYRRDIRPDSARTSMLFGLYQSERDLEGTRKKIFFIPLGHAKPERH
jgi:hypothetical protein